MKYLLKFDDAVHSDEAVLSSDAVRYRSRAVGHARTARRAAAIAALFYEAVPAFAARKGIGCLRALRSSTEPDIFRRTRCTVKTAAKNTVASLPTIMLGAGAPGRRFSRLTKDGARKNDAAAQLLEDVRREHPHLKAGGGRAGRTASSQGVGPALGSEARGPQVFGGSTAHRPWNTESSRTRTTRYGVQRYAPSK